MPHDPWPHQAALPDKLYQAFREGHRWIAVTVPTGGGKTRSIVDLAVRGNAKGKRVGIFTNKKILTSQGSGALEEAGVEHGVIAAGYERTKFPTGDDYRSWHNVQVLSLQTIGRRAISGESMGLPPFDLVIIDEAHSCTEGFGEEIVRHYKQAGAMGIGFSATPVGLGRYHTVGGKVEPLHQADHRGHQQRPAEVWGHC